MTLRAIIDAAAIEHHLSMGDLTVMSNLTDPYRLDTPANHRLGRWLADAWRASGARDRIHLRGLHYAFVSMDPAPEMPSGGKYVNSHDCWSWLATAARAARWLGYVPFDSLDDERNAAPIIHTVDDYPPPSVYITGASEPLGAPSIAGRLPSVQAYDFSARQAYRLVLIGEKGSLAEVLEPLARRYCAELVLPTGELSTALLYGIVRRAARDGRPCRIFYLSDFDPTGWQMPIGVARKIQALIDLEYQGIDVQMRRCALTFDQVQHFRLPATPMKDTEKRADRWRERWGVEQTEIDALATLRPSDFSRIVSDALAPYWDTTLETRLAETRNQVVRAANAVLADQIEAARYELQPADDLIKQADRLLTQAYDVMAPVVERIRRHTVAALPDYCLPEPNPHGDATEPIFDSVDTFARATQRLIEEKL